MRRLLTLLLALPLVACASLGDSGSYDVDFTFARRVVVEVGGEGERGELSLTNRGNGPLVLVVTSPQGEPIELAPGARFELEYEGGARMVLENDTDHLGRIAIDVDGRPRATLEIVGDEG